MCIYICVTYIHTYIYKPTLKHKVSIIYFISKQEIMNDTKWNNRNSNYIPFDIPRHQVTTTLKGSWFSRCRTTKGYKRATLGHETGQRNIEFSLPAPRYVAILLRLCRYKTAENLSQGKEIFFTTTPKYKDTPRANME